MNTKDSKEFYRYYLSDCYEIDDSAVGGIKEKLYLGGDFYTAHAVYVKEGNGSWQIYYICRDYLGSITHVTNSSGTVVQELSYDAWGRLRNPVNQTPYAPDSEPVLFLGRGYTGHEHLTQFGLINMNARLYDPAVGRFLSPDPFVQAPGFSQSFNRYSYCLNNPFRYTDPDGEIAWLVAIVAGYFVFGTDAGYQLQKYVSPVAVQIDFKWGTHQKGLGINAGIGLPKAFSPVAPWVDAGATYYWTSYGDYKGWEYRLGAEVTLFGCFTYGQTQYWAGEYTQRVGYLKFGIPGNVGVDIYNDAFGDGGDRFRTSRVRLNSNPFYIENVLFTGDPGLKSKDRRTDDNNEYIINPNNPYADPDRYRHGILSLGIGPLSIGYDSEKIRHNIQTFIHSLPFFKSRNFHYLKEWKDKGWFFQFGGW